MPALIGVVFSFLGSLVARIGASWIVRFVVLKGLLIALVTIVLKGVLIWVALHMHAHIMGLFMDYVFPHVENMLVNATGGSQVLALTGWAAWIAEQTRLAEFVGIILTGAIYSMIVGFIKTR